VQPQRGALEILLKGVNGKRLLQRDQRAGILARGLVMAA
jgi:hypothetical protein